MVWTPQADGASPVLMLRSLPEGTAEAELVEWAEAFRYEPRDPTGKVTGGERNASCVKALVLRDRQLGFVQFSDIWAARAVMSTFLYDPPSIRLMVRGQSHALNLVYSDKPEIRAHGVLKKGPRDTTSAGGAGSSRLLLIVPRDLRGPIHLDELYWILTQFGRVEKISWFERNARHQFVAQFTSADRAAMAMGYLNARALPARDGSVSAEPLCTLSIVPSRLPELTFRAQDTRNQDYTVMNTLVERLLRTNAARAGQKERAGFDWQRLWAEETGRLPQGPPPQFFDFIWGERLWGEGWLHPRQAEQWRGLVPPVSANWAAGERERERERERGAAEWVTVSGLPPTGVLSGGEGLWQLCGMFGCVQAVRMLHGGGVACVQMASPEDAACLERSLPPVLETRPGRHPSWFASMLTAALPQPPRNDARVLPPSCGLHLLEPLPPGIRLDSVVGMTGAVCSGADGATLWFSSALDAATAAARWNGALVAGTPPRPFHDGMRGAGVWRLKLRFASPVPHREPATPPPSHLVSSPPTHSSSYPTYPLSPPTTALSPPPPPAHPESGSEHWSHTYHQHTPYSYAPTPGHYSSASSTALTPGPHCDATPSPPGWQSPLYAPQRHPSPALHHHHHIHHLS
eukprot:Hpha_TRINITY_DN16768_c0_g1::TRINITY_DN16768_c0_g1_i1::g.77052::m.77052